MLALEGIARANINNRTITVPKLDEKVAFGSYPVILFVRQGGHSEHVMKEVLIRIIPLDEAS